MSGEPNELKTDNGESSARESARPTPGNGFFSLMDQTVVSGTRFLVTVLIAKACGEVVLGIYALVLSLVLMALMVQQTLVTTPYSNFRNRMSPRDESQYYCDSWFLSLTVSGLAVFLMILTGAIFWSFSVSEHQNASSEFPMDQMAFTCWAAALALPTMIAVEFFRRTWLIRMRAKRAFIMDTIVSLLTMGSLGSLYYFQRLDENSVFFVMAAINLLVAIVVFRILLPTVHFSKSSIWNHANIHWKFGKWIFSSEAMTFGRGHLMKWIIGAFLGMGFTGFYSACDSLMRAINPFFLGVASVAEPTLAAGYAKSGRKEVKRIAYKVLLIMVVGTFPICVVVALMSKQLLLYLYGPVFAEYAAVVVLLAMGAFINSSAYPFANSIQAIDRPEINFRIRLLTFAIVVLAAFFVTPIWGLWGVALLQLIGSLISMAARVFIFNRLFSEPEAESETPHDKPAGSLS